MEIPWSVWDSFSLCKHGTMILISSVMQMLGSSCFVSSRLRFPTLTYVLSAKHCRKPHEMKWVIIYQQDGKQLILGFGEEKSVIVPMTKRQKERHNNRRIKTFHQAQKWDEQKRGQKPRERFNDDDSRGRAMRGGEINVPLKERKQYRTIAS